VVYIKIYGIYIFYKWISCKTHTFSKLIRVPWPNKKHHDDAHRIVAYYSTRTHLWSERDRTRELRMKATPLKSHPQKFNLISRCCAFDPLRLNICKAHSETRDIFIPFRSFLCSKKISTSHWLDHRFLIISFCLSMKQDNCNTF